MSTYPVSVVIPLYNKARHIKRALDSVLAQVHREFEVIVVNDGSTDGSEEVVKVCTDPRVRLINQENAGVSVARNRGIAEARAELVAFLDADDQWLPGHLITILRLRLRFPDCGVYATAHCFMAKDRKLIYRSYRNIPASPWEGLVNYFRSDPFTSSTVAVPKHAFDAVGRFRIGVWFSEDSDMWCRIALEFPVAFSTRIGAIIHREADNRTTGNVSRGRSCLLATGDIKDWPKFLANLFKAGKAAGPSPGRRIWELLPEDAREIAGKVAAGSFPEQHRAAITKALNSNILGRRDFYEAECFSRISASEEVRRLLSSILTLSDSDVRKLNRLLMESAYPSLIVKRILCRDWQPAKTLAGVLGSGRLRPGISEEDIAEFLYKALRCPGLRRRTNSQS